MKIYLDTCSLQRPLDSKSHIRIVLEVEREIGLVNTVRFVNQFTVGYGNYTEEREALFADLTMDEIVNAIKHKHAQTTAAEE
jgi:hypothetical protein